MMVDLILLKEMKRGEERWEIYKTREKGEKGVEENGREILKAVVVAAAVCSSSSSGSREVEAERKS